jgi:hypothetical protein
MIHWLKEKKDYTKRVRKPTTSKEDGIYQQAGRQDRRQPSPGNYGLPRAEKERKK